jgi:hypothetical protein
MNKRFAFGAAGVAVLLAVGAPMAARATGMHDDGGRNFTVIAKQTHFAFRGASPSHPAPGDTFVLEASLFRPERDMRTADERQWVGIDTITCTYGFDSNVLCTGTYWFNDRGQIDAQVLLKLDATGRPASAFDIAVTGGTGAWRSAQGVAHLDTEMNNVERVTFDLDRA